MKEGLPNMGWTQHKHEVNLHGVLHRNVEGMVWKELLYAQDYNCFPIKFVTGNSKKMKEIVIDVVDGGGYTTLHQVFPNTGFILVQE